MISSSRRGRREVLLPLQVRSDETLILLEVSRKDLVAKSRVQDKRRFSRRLNYQVSNFRGCDLKQLFENDMLVFTTPINGYECTISFPGVFTALKRVVRSTRGDPNKINLQMVIRALRIAFDATDDVKVNCTCGDWKYRFAYWATQNGYKYGPPEDRPSDITNPDDALGATCKHLSLLLSNKRWVVKVASVVNSFIKAYPDKASLYLYDTYPMLPAHEDDPSEEDDSNEKVLEPKDDLEVDDVEDEEDESDDGEDEAEEGTEDEE